MTNNDEQLNNVTEQSQSTELAADGFVEPSENVSAPTDSVKQKRNKAELVINIVLWIAIAVLLVAVVLRLFVFGTVAVDGASMNPTYTHGDVVTVNKMAAPKRGDVVVLYVNDVKNKFMAQFAKPEECTEGQQYQKYIKRVVATAGDKIWVQSVAEFNDDILYEVVINTVDGDLLYENYYVKDGNTLNIETFYLHSQKGASHLGNLQGCTKENPFVVSEGCFFAMGDNRIDSKDSRALGEFKVSQLFGVVLDK